MQHWKVKFMRRGSEPPMPFGKTDMIVCARTRDEAKDKVPASPRYPITASKSDNPKVTFTMHCSCERNA